MSQPQALACGDRERPATQQVANGREPSIARTQGASILTEISARPRTPRGDGSQPQPHHNPTTHHRCTTRRAGTWNQSSKAPVRMPAERGARRTVDLDLNDEQRSIQETVR